MFIKRFLSIALMLLHAGLLLSFYTLNSSGEQWYDQTKAEILKQSALKSDSVALFFNSDSSVKKETYFSKGHKFLAKFYRKGKYHSESYFSKDGHFELRRQFCENAVVSFEGIAYNTSLYGPFTIYFCNGYIQQQGSHYRSEKIGTWKTYDDTGKLLDESNMHFHALLDSMPQIAK